MTIYRHKGRVLVEMSQHDYSNLYQRGGVTFSLQWSKGLDGDTQTLLGMLHGPAVVYRWNQYGYSPIRQYADNLRPQANVAKPAGYYVNPAAVVMVFKESWLTTQVPMLEQLPAAIDAFATRLASLVDGVAFEFQPLKDFFEQLRGWQTAPENTPNRTVASALACGMFASVMYEPPDMAGFRKAFAALMEKLASQRSFIPRQRIERMAKVI